MLGLALAVSLDAATTTRLRNMFTNNELKQQRSIKAIAGCIDQLVNHPMVKVDKGGTVTRRDKAVRKIMPKAMNCLDRSISKDKVLTMVLNMIEKVEKMTASAKTSKLNRTGIDNLLAQLWTVYAAIQHNHREDDHWQISDLPQPWNDDHQGAIALRFGDMVYLLERELVTLAASYHVGETGDSTRGYQFTGGIMEGSSSCDNIGGDWSKAEQYGHERLQTLNCEQVSEDIAFQPTTRAMFIGPVMPLDFTPCRQSVPATRQSGPSWEPCGFTRETRETVKLPDWCKAAKTVQIDQAERTIDREFSFGQYDTHPRAKMLINTDESIAANRKWLASL